MCEYKVGDKVEVVKEHYSEFKVGDVGTITSIGVFFDTDGKFYYYRIDGDKLGAPANYFKKV